MNNDLLLKYLPFMEEMKQKMRMNDDCFEMIVLAFLEKDPDRMNEIEKRGEMKPFIGGIMRNYWKSKTSPYYYTYIVPVKN